ncbi:MAG: hypothetical protein AAGK22_18625 [Acidobacteriota bacterium]
MARTERLYAALPRWAQNAAVTAYGVRWKRLRFGGRFAEHLAAFRQRDSWSAAEWERFQAQSLEAVLTAAAENVPHYAESWTSKQKEAARRGALEELPILDKAPLREHPELFIDRSHPSDGVLRFHTSGTSGTPIVSFFTRSELQATMAVREARSAGWAGVSFEQPRATFSGRIVVPDAASQGPFHRFNRAEQQVYFSAFHLSPQNAEQYVAALHEHGVRWLTGYAVSTYLLARAILERGLERPVLDAVITTSEKLEPRMRSVIEEAFQCRAFEEYSSVENVCFASECEEGSLHVSPDVGVIEILDERGQRCPPGEVGEVVVTSLIKRYQPLVRFRIGDVASWSREPCPCGRALPVLEQVVGRIEDVVRTPDGRETVRFHGLFVDLPAIVEGQVVQRALDRIEVRIVAEPWTEELSNELAGRVRQRLGTAVHVDVTPVDRIPRGPSGKFQPVVSRLEGSERTGAAREAHP